jgi:hypothetical protein
MVPVRPCSTRAYQGLRLFAFPKAVDPHLRVSDQEQQCLPLLPAASVVKFRPHLL